MEPLLSNGSTCYNMLQSRILIEHYIKTIKQNRFQRSRNSIKTSHCFLLHSYLLLKQLKYLFCVKLLVLIIFYHDTIAKGLDLYVVLGFTF
jgi:hypothetical protein